ncbi:oligosaccharide flippase family protein [Mediterraneibacter faecis]|uniref:oligosaccharide flippase family protein n=1 Tax=Mediterraneibacter faecis TaxID=592978 RepID=UPI0032C1C66C
MQNKKNTLINMLSALIFLCVQMFISFWLSPFVVGRLGEEAYGFINLANNFVSYASLLSVAINSMSSRYISVEYNSGRVEEAKSYFCSVFVVNCFLYGLILIISIIFIGRIELIINIPSKFLFQVKLTFLLSFLNMGASLIGTVYMAASFTTNKMHYNSLIQIVSNVVKTIVVFVLFSVLPAKIYYLSIATLVAGIITLYGNFYITKILFSEFKIKWKYFKFSKLIILVKSGFWVLISNISNLLLNGLDLLFSNWFISSAIMGRLSLAKQIPLALSSALGVFSNIFSSALTKSFVVDGDEGIINEAYSQLRILTFFFTVPYAGLIAYGENFLHLWLSNTNYSMTQIEEIYTLMLLVLLDIIISTYMYSIHSIFIALDKVRVYSIVLFIASVVSMTSTLFLLKFTNLGVYAIAGTSTVVLGFTHGIIVPGVAGKLLNKPIWLFWKSELNSWTLLFIVYIVFVLLRFVLNLSSWSLFGISIMIAGVIGYIISFFIILNKAERLEIKKLIKRS